MQSHMQFQCLTFCIAIAVVLLTCCLISDAQQHYRHKVNANNMLAFRTWDGFRTLKLFNKLVLWLCSDRFYWTMCPGTQRKGSLWHQELGIVSDAKITHP